MWLGFLRENGTGYESHIRYIREEVLKGNLTLADIGTSEEEIELLRVKGCRNTAHMWLGYLRSGTTEYNQHIRYIREELSNGNLSLFDIGTSEEEIELLRVKGCRNTAHMWLGYLRNDTTKFNSYIGYIREEVRSGNLTLADIGTSEKELERLRPV